MAARTHLRRKFLSARVAVSGANFAVAETGTLAVVESEGNGRMCLTLPQTLITVMGIEKVVPTWTDLEVFLQLLPRSSTGERMNPYTSMWTGVTPGDGPQEFHLVLLDNGRTAVLADEVGREALHCIRCSACLNVCPVYERTGGHAYGSVYPGPIGAVLTPQLTGVADNPSLPYASTLCGACFDACPVRIDIPSMLVHLRARHVEEHAATGVPVGRGGRDGGRGLGDVLAAPLRRGRRAARARPAARPPARGRHPRLPPPLLGVDARPATLPCRRAETFREWWRRSRGDADRCSARGRGAGPHPPRPAGPAVAPDVRARLPARGRPSRPARPSCWSCLPTGWSTTGPAVHHATAATLPAVLASVLDTTGRVVVPPGLPGRLGPRGAVVDDGPEPAELDGFDTVLTGVRRRAPPRPAPSCWTPRPTRAAARSRSCPTGTSAWCAPPRSCRPFPSCWPGSTRADR